MFMPPHLDLSAAPLWVRLAWIAALGAHMATMLRCGAVLFAASRTNR